MDHAKHPALIAAAALLALGCSRSGAPAETPRQTSDQADQAAGYTEENPEPRGYNREDPVWDDMGDFDDTDFRDDGPGPDDDSGRGD